MHIGVDEESRGGLSQDDLSRSDPDLLTRLDRTPVRGSHFRIGIRDRLQAAEDGEHFSQ